MPFNGSGTYAAPALPGSWNPAVTGSSATPADWNTLLTDLSTALSTCVTKDGQTTITANIPMANHKITGLADATALTDALNGQSSWMLFDQQTVTGVTFVDFVNIPATANNLQCVFQFQPSADGVSISLQTYGADGVLDTGGTDYYFAVNIVNSSAVQAATGSAGSASIGMDGGLVIDNSTVGYGGEFTAMDIQAATFTKFTFSNTFLDSAGAVFVANNGGGGRREADLITGVRIFVTSGTFAGKASLFVSV